jgi:cell division protein FtsL
MAPWMIVASIAVAGFFGLGFARTSLDRAAFELAELDQAIAQQNQLNLELKLDIARLENPARIAPLAEEMGLVIPDFTHQLLVDLDGKSPVVAGADRDGSNQ